VPGYRGKGYGAAAVDEILREAFDTLNLDTVYGEVYNCNDAGYSFWSGIIDRYGAYKTMLPDRKFWDGRLWNSIYFSISPDDYRGRDER
jgi:RimJ/RimL family protein N-acetyltransferase